MHWCCSSGSQSLSGDHRPVRWQDESPGCVRVRCIIQRPRMLFQLYTRQSTLAMTENECVLCLLGEHVYITWVTRPPAPRSVIGLYAWILPCLYHLACSTYTMLLFHGDGDGAGASAVVLPRAPGVGKKSGIYVYRCVRNRAWVRSGTGRKRTTARDITRRERDLD